jgi:hypothetical protein
MNCLSCGKAATCQRQLCHRCYYHPEIRVRYPLLDGESESDLCANCAYRVANAGRGLCYPCHKQTKIRSLYQTQYVNNNECAEPTAAEVDALVESNRATMPTEGTHGRPRQLRFERKNRADYNESATWQQWFPVGPTYELHPDTDPRMIQEVHRGLVRRARKRCPKASAERIAKMVCLPVWNVKRHWKCGAKRKAVLA